jgi:sugar phosphate isomerase/epimerase
MQLGLDSFSFHIALAAGDYDLFRTLGWMEAQGLQGLQININGPNGRFLGGEPADTAHVRRVRRAFEQKGFFSEIGGRCTSPDMLAWQLRLCAELGAGVLRTLLIFQDDLAKTFAQTRRDLEASLPLARSLGVRIALENHEDVTAAELRQFLDLIDDPFLGACLDTGNDLVVYGDPLAAARELAPRALSTHLKDHRLVRVAGTVQSVGVPLGAGDIELPPIIDVIRRASPLDRLLIQDTTGYSSVLNPFKRVDLHPPHDYPDLPVYASVDELRADGLFLNLNGLSAAELSALAIRQEQNLSKDIAYLRRLLATV